MLVFVVIRLPNVYGVDRVVDVFFSELFSRWMCGALPWRPSRRCRFIHIGDQLLNFSLYSGIFLSNFCGLPASIRAKGVQGWPLFLSKSFSRWMCGALLRRR